MRMRTEESFQEWESLVITDEANDNDLLDFEILGGLEDVDDIYVMIGFPLKRGNFRLENLRADAKTLWGEFANPIILPITNGRFSLLFKSQDEIDLIWKNGPWTFGGITLGTRQVRHNQAFDEVTMDSLTFWIQLHNLPLYAFTESVVRQIGEKVGEVEEICFEDEEGTPYEEIVRIRVVANIYRHLVPAVRMKRENRWIYIKYENLPTICKFCGVLTHDEDDCIAVFNLSSVPLHLQAWAGMIIPGAGINSTHFPFGEWMGCPRYRRDGDGACGNTLIASAYLRRPENGLKLFQGPYIFKSLSKDPKVLPRREKRMDPKGKEPENQTFPPISAGQMSFDDVIQDTYTRSDEGYAGDNGENGRRYELTMTEMETYQRGYGIDQRRIMEGGEEKGMGDASSAKDEMNNIARNKFEMMRTDNKEMAKLAGGASDQLPNNDEGQRRLAWPLRIDDTQKSRKNNVKGKTITTAGVAFAFILAATGGLMIGYDIGILGGVASMDSFLEQMFPSAYHKIKDEGDSTSCYCKFDNQVLKLFTSSFCIAALISSFFASTMMRKLGCQPIMLLGGLIYFNGVAISFVSPYISMLICGRTMVGFGIGMINQSVPLYVSEIAPAKIRGFLNHFFQLMITFGILCANIINYFTSKIKGGCGWRISIVLAAIPAAITIFAAINVPNTPNFLIDRYPNNPKRALEILRRIRGTPDVQEEYDDLVAAKKEAQHLRSKLLQRKCRPQLFMPICITLLQQITGTNFIIFYAPVLFKSIGFNSSVTLLSSVIVAAVNALSTFIAILTVNKVHRRTLFLAGGIQMIICQIGLGVLVGLKFGLHGATNMPRGYTDAVLAFICISVAGFGWSWGLLGRVVPSEIFPLESQFAYQSITANMLFTSLFALVFLKLLCGMQYFLFFYFAVMVMIMTSFVFFFLPETKGNPMEEMHWCWRQFYSSSCLRPRESPWKRCIGVGGSFIEGMRRARVQTLPAKEKLK